MRRFRIAQHSMLPNLVPGQEVVATDSRHPQVGDIVAFPHPHRDDFWLVKRMVAPPEPLPESLAWVMSDNPEATLADSRSLGALPRSSLLVVVERLDPRTFEEACELLIEEDPALAEIVGRHGLPEFWQREPGFPTLVWLILEQQVSLESGAAMYRRLIDTVGDVTPERLLQIGENELRSIGVTRQKTGYLLSLAESVVSGRLDLERLEALSEQRARDELTAIRGVGTWTADAYLLSALRHPDTFPVGDRALQVGVGEMLGMQKPATEPELEILSEQWRPIRAAAARLVWHAYLSSRGRSEPPDPTGPHTHGRYA